MHPETELGETAEGQISGGAICIEINEHNKFRMFTGHFSIIPPKGKAAVDVICETK